MVPRDTAGVPARGGLESGRGTER